MGLSVGLGVPSQVPVGVVSAFAGVSAPVGWLMCAGQAVSRSDYSALFTALGTTYGAGDGSTTFNLPDLRGRVPAGVDNMGGSAASRLTSTVLSASNTLGATGGAQTHTLVVGEIPAAEVRVNDGSNTFPLLGAGGGSTGGYLGRPATEFPNAFGAGQRPATINGGGGAHTNTQPTLVLNYIIKATQ
jgi:microcystin-dependent protein